MEDSVPEEAKIINQALDRETHTMVCVKWSDNVEGSGDSIDAHLCGVI